MKNRTTLLLSTCLVLGFSGSAVDPVSAEGSSPFNMMNPNRWFGGKNRDHDDYGYRPYGGAYGQPYGPPGYGGAPYGVPPGYGYGAPQAPQAYTPAQPPAPGAQPQTEDASASRIRELEERIRQLEASRQSAPQAGTPSRQDYNDYAAPQAPPAPSTWQGSTNTPAPSAPPAPPSGQGTQDAARPATQAPMPPPWQRPAGNNPQAVTEPPAAPSWQGAGAAPRMPASPTPELQGDAPEQKHRFRPF